jgi:hypothetical protein
MISGTSLRQSRAFTMYQKRPSLSTSCGFRNLEAQNTVFPDKCPFFTASRFFWFFLPDPPPECIQKNEKNTLRGAGYSFLI